jgi:hypothetical protein
MPKYTKRNKKRKINKIMRGGFTDLEEQLLLQKGFSLADIEFLESLHMNMNLIEMSLNSINPSTGLNWTAQELINDLYNIDNDINSINSSEHSSLGNSYLSNISNLNESLNLSNISEDSNHDISLDNSLNLSNNIDNEDSSLHLSDLEGNPSALTDYPSNNSSLSNNSSFLNNSNNSIFLNNSNNSHDTTRGGKYKRKRNKKNTLKKIRKSISRR